MGVRPSWSVTLQALHEGTGVWLPGSMAPSMRPWVLSAALKGKKKVCPLKSLPSWLLPKKEAGEQWVTDRLPRDKIYTEVGHTEEG